MWGRRFRLPTARSTNATCVDSLPGRRLPGWNADYKARVEKVVRDSPDNAAATSAI
jgi:hypothetical protein